MIGVPSTAAFAAELSVPAILARVRAGRVFTDVEGRHDRTLNLTASVDGRTARMGEAIAVPRGKQLVFTIGVTGVDKGSVEIVSNMVMPRLGNRNIAPGRATIDFRMTSRDAAGLMRTMCAMQAAN